MKIEFKAVILDMDGLLLDTEPVYKQAWQYGGKQLGYQLSDQLCDEFSGNSLTAIRQRLFDILGSQFDFERFLTISSDYWYDLIAQHGVQPMPGAQRLLEGLQSHQIDYALATNSPSHIARHCLNHAGLESQFPIRATSDQVKQTKPAPDLYALAMKKLDIPAKQCLCVEDSIPGVQSAHCAGGQTAMISHSKNHQAASHMLDYQFHSLHELVDYFLCLS
ncbi:MAG: HAD family phosphatase [Gammaproteobacteria bacterium]|nr:HAD family phosphatase [Gammaproteobacteria bacterium]